MSSQAANEWMLSFQRVGWFGFFEASSRGEKRWDQTFTGSSLAPLVFAKVFARSNATPA